jgi:hypothetical protein
LIQAVPRLRHFVAGLSTRRLGFEAGSIHVGFVALEEIFSEFFGFPLSASFHRDFPYSYIIWQINNTPTGGRSSETQLPIDINMKIYDRKI